MKDYTPNLKGRDVVLISDAVVDEYDNEDKAEEAELLTAIKDELAKHNIGFTAIEVSSTAELSDKLSKLDKNKIVIFNWCEEITGQPNTGHLITQFLDGGGYIYSGADTRTFLLTADRAKMKALFIAKNIPTPKYWILTTPETCKKVNAFPVLIKSRKDHGSFGITKKSILENQQQLVDYFKILRQQTDREFIAEQFIVGDEYISSVWGNNEPEVLPILQVAFDSQQNDKYKLQDYGSKWDKSSPDFKGVYIKTPQHLSRTLENKLKEISADAYKTLGACGFARLEIRVDATGVPYIIDFNANPNFRPHTSFLMAAEAVGYNYGEVVLKMCEFALKKHGQS